MSTPEPRTERGPRALDPSDFASRLTDAAVWPDAIGVERRETHVSWLFFTDHEVFKVKKPVDLGFVDMRTLAERRRLCEEEVRLNRALAPGIHKGVVAVALTPDDRIVVSASPPKGSVVVDYAVRMRRLPATAMLDRRLDRGEVDNRLLDTIAATVASFHENAATGADVDVFGDPKEVARLAIENFEALEPFVAESDHLHGSARDVVSRPIHDHLLRWTRTELEALRDVMLDRVARGRIRDGHGDLHAENICILDDGPIIYDRVEFGPRFRCCDVVADAAFLAMDLDHRGFRAFSKFFVRRYLELAGDDAPAELVRFYVVYRAMVRAKVCALLAAELRGRVQDGAGILTANEAAAARARAMSHLHLATALTLPPVLVLTCGLPATGKSELARHLAAPFEAVVLRSDVIRKEGFGYGPTDPVPPQERSVVYGSEATARTYGELLTRARRWLAEGRSVIADATFSTRALREPFIALAREGGHPFAVAQVFCHEDVVRRRLAARRRDAANVSDADVETYLALRDRFEPVDELECDRRLLVDGCAAPEDQLDTVIAQIVSHAGTSS